MSGFATTQENTTFEINIGAGFVAFPCVNTFNRGTDSIERLKTTCFSSPPKSAEYANGEVTFGEGAVGYNMDIAAAIHQWLLNNQNGDETIQIRTVISDGTASGSPRYTSESTYLVGGVEENIEFGAILINTVSLQKTGATTRTFDVIP